MSIDIIKTNNQIKKKLDTEKALENTIDEWTQVLQYHVATLIDNELPGVNQSTHRSGRPLKSIRQRLKGIYMQALYMYLVSMVDFINQVN